MRDKVERKVIKLLDGRDSAHDFQHIKRVYKNAEVIGQREGADMKILLPAALLHDLVVYPKGSAKTSKSADDSADMAEKLLKRDRKSTRLNSSHVAISYAVFCLKKKKKKQKKKIKKQYKRTEKQ